MKNLISNIKDRVYYSLASIGNRYPCKIIKIEHLNNFTQDIIITFRILSNLNIRTMKLKKLIDDGLLIEKFHPTDCIKMGFASFGNILLRNNDSADEIKTNFIEISSKLFKELSFDKLTKKEDQ